MDSNFANACKAAPSPNYFESDNRSLIASRRKSTIDNF